MPTPRSSPSYDEDFFTWSQRQAELLRGLRRSAARLPNDLDLDNLAEEVEDLGRSELNTVRSHLGHMLVHLVKAASVPGAQPVNHWLEEVAARRRDAALSFTPGMRQRVDLDAIWRGAVSDATAALRRRGDPVASLPEACPFALDDLLDDGRAVDDLLVLLTPRQA